MITVDQEFVKKINSFLREKVIDGKLINLKDILICKRYEKEILSIINQKIKEKEIAFRIDNLEYLLGQKNYDSTFFSKSDTYINEDLVVEPKMLDLIEELFCVIKNNSYYPIKKEIMERATLFLKRYNGISSSFNESIKQELCAIINELSDAISYPCSLLDCDYAIRMNETKNNFLNWLVYVNKTVHKYIGVDQEAEDLLSELIELKNTNT